MKDFASKQIGPNRLEPAENYSTISRKEAVKLRLGLEFPTAEKPTSVPGLFKRITSEYGDHVALKYKNGKDWESVTYR